MGASGEWVPLYITFFLGVVLFTVVPATVDIFCETVTVNNFPVFSPENCPINSYEPFIFDTVNFINNGIVLYEGNTSSSGGSGGLLALFRYFTGTSSSTAIRININFFSLFGFLPDNVVQQFLTKSLGSFIYLPERIAFISLALFFIGLIYSISRIIRGT